MPFGRGLPPGAVDAAPAVEAALDLVNSVGDLREAVSPNGDPARVGSAEPIPAGETASAII